MSEQKYKERLVSRIRKDDVVLQEHFSEIKHSDYPHEIRRLLEKAILSERDEKIKKSSLN